MGDSMVGSYRGVVLVSRNDAVCQVLLGADDRETYDAFHHLVGHTDAYLAPGGLGATDVNGEHLHYLVAPSQEDDRVALVIRMPGQRPQVALFTDWFAALGAGLEALKAGAAIQVLAVQGLREEPGTQVSAELPHSRILGPIAIPPGWCQRCGDHLLSKPDDLFCETCQRLDKIHPHLLP